MKYLAIAILMLSSLAQANSTISTIELYHNCQDAIKDLDGQSVTPAEQRHAWNCVGFFQGWVTAEQGSLLLGDDMKTPVRIVFSDDTTFEQDIRVFVKYLDNHPDLLSQDPHIAICEAFYKSNIMSNRAVAAKTLRKEPGVR
jgi:hypothetical protein